MESKHRTPTSPFKLGRKPFNRTSMESKHDLIVQSLPVESPFNRTSMESKLVKRANSYLVDTTFNRTSMESKQTLCESRSLISRRTFNRTSMESKLYRIWNKYDFR